MDSSRRETAFHRALHRPQLIMGGERELMLFSMLIAAGLIVSALNFIATVIGISIWVVCVWALRKMAKSDPSLSKIYIRQLKYGNYYGPYSRPYRVAKTSRIF